MITRNFLSPASMLLRAYFLAPLSLLATASSVSTAFFTDARRLKSGTQVCATHGKSRTLPNLRRTPTGNYVCKFGRECKVESSSASAAGGGVVGGPPVSASAAPPPRPSLAPPLEEQATGEEKKVPGEVCKWNLQTVISADYDGCWDVLFEPTRAQKARTSSLTAAGSLEFEQALRDDLDAAAAFFHEKLHQLVDAIRGPDGRYAAHAAPGWLFVGSNRQSLNSDKRNRGNSQNSFQLPGSPRTPGASVFAEYESFVDPENGMLGAGWTLDKLLLSDYESNVPAGRAWRDASIDVDGGQRNERGMVRQREEELLNPVLPTRKGEDVATWALKSALLRLQMQEIDFYRKQFGVGKEGVTKFYFFDDRFDILSYIHCIKGSRLLPIPEGIELHICRWDWHDFIYVDEKGAKPEIQGFLPEYANQHKYCTQEKVPGGGKLELDAGELAAIRRAVGI